MSQKIVPSLWCRTDVDAMFSLYQGAFGEVARVTESFYPTEGLLEFQQDMAGKTLSLEISIYGFNFLLVNGGPVFTANPSVSFMVRFSHADFAAPSAELRKVWDALMAGGKALMPLDSYDFASLYGWVEDAYGISWQLMLEDDPTNEEAAKRPRIQPTLMFGKPVFGQARAAMRRYQEVFPGSGGGLSAVNPDDDSLAYGDATLAGQWVGFQDSASADFTFSEAVSFVVNCADQTEIDHYWNALSRVPEAEQCGWCKDEFGVSWQITPLSVERYMANPAVWSAMMHMKKLDIAALEALL